jgi:NTP pyrophosphatase (non-canonical NTP hydrolase)
VGELNRLAQEISRWREEKGFVTNWEGMLAKLMLVVTEVSEAAEAVREENRERFAEEIADTFIRLLDICGSIGLDIERQINRKMEVNRDRPYRHGKKSQW